jgi:hypothetical protein
VGQGGWCARAATAWEGSPVSSGEEDSGVAGDTLQQATALPRCCPGCRQHTPALCMQARAVLVTTEAKNQWLFVASHNTAFRPLAIPAAAVCTKRWGS